MDRKSSLSHLDSSFDSIGLSVASRKLIGVKNTMPIRLHLLIGAFDPLLGINSGLDTYPKVRVTCPVLTKLYFSRE